MDRDLEGERPQSAFISFVREGLRVAERARRGMAASSLPGQWRDHLHTAELKDCARNMNNERHLADTTYANGKRRKKHGWLLGTIL